ncbi:MAG: hypothetical protein GY744_03270 [Gammaproteobacteria bacterium]|nr:hypothetical protein [Gammaproteobacteria bacterium]
MGDFSAKELQFVQRILSQLSFKPGGSEQIIISESIIQKIEAKLSEFETIDSEKLKKPDKKV